MKYVFGLLLMVLVLKSVVGQDILLLKTNGKVVIGDTSQISTPGPYNLYVQNGVLTEKVKVALEETAQWSDHAFNYTPSLEQVKHSIENHSHLYQMPSAESLVQTGYDIQDMDAKILAQVEWLWQHVIKLSEENNRLKNEIEKIRKEER